MGWLRRRVPFVPQIEVTECGAACLTMILAHHGHHAPLAELRQACGISRGGADALALVRAARRYGLEASGVKVEKDQLEALPLPAVLHWDFEHFLVLERLGRKRATLVDPATGRRQVSLEELGRHFTGVALALRPSPALRRRKRVRPAWPGTRRSSGRRSPTWPRSSSPRSGSSWWGSSSPSRRRSCSTR